MTSKLRRPQARWNQRRPRWRDRAALLLLIAAVLYLIGPRLVQNAQGMAEGLLGRGHDRDAPIEPIAAPIQSAAADPAAAKAPELGPPEPRIGKLAPEIRVPDVEGRTLNLAELRGKVVLLNFWASWCKPCEAEMADLQVLHAQEAARGFTVVGLNEGEEPGRAAEFLRAKGITFPTGLDLDMTVTRRYEVFGLPNTFLIDRHGVIRDRIIGPLALEQMRERVVKVALGQPIERPRLVSIWGAMAAENDKPAAEVSGHTITMGEVNRRVDLENALIVLRGGLTPEFITPEGRARLREQQRALAERLVDERLIAARSQAVGLSIPEAEVAADVERIAGETNLDADGLRRELAALGSDIGLLAEERRAARLIGAFTLDYILAGRTPERTRDVDAWMDAARSAARVRILMPWTSPPVPGAGGGTDGGPTESLPGTRHTR